MAVVSCGALGLSACAGDGLGFTASGEMVATATDPAAPGPTRYGFSFAGQRVDPTLTAGMAGGVTGTCRVGPSGREVRLESVGGPASQLRALRITMNDWADDACTDCLHGTASVTIGPTVFTAEDRRVGGRSACTVTAQRVDSLGMTVQVSCPGLSAAGDPRSVNLAGQLTLQSCDGQESR